MRLSFFFFGWQTAWARSRRRSRRETARHWKRRGSCRRRYEWSCRLLCVRACNIFLATIVSSSSGEAPAKFVCEKTLQWAYTDGVTSFRGYRAEFELGLELDSAEVRGVLIYQGQDWGRVVFDYRA